MSSSFDNSPKHGIVMVHRDWNDNGRRPVPSSLDLTRQEQEEPPKKANVAQRFEFINGTDPFRNKDPEVRRLVRAHVVKDASYKRKQASLLGKKNGKLRERREVTAKHVIAEETEEYIITATNKQHDHTANLTGPNNLFPNQGLDPHPTLSPILYHIASMGTAMWPLELSCGFNHLSPASWFDWALSDDALFQALLYTTSTYAGLLTGVTENKESIVHSGSALRLLQQRIIIADINEQSAQAIEIDEETMAAISCLALSEALRGNFHVWKIHMSGLSQIISLRPLTSLRLSLQLKLQRADQTGAIHSLVPPLLAPSTSLLQNYTYAEHTPSSSLVALLCSLPLSSGLVPGLLRLSHLSNTFAKIVSDKKTVNEKEQIGLLQATYALRYELLHSTSIFLPHDEKVSLHTIIDDVLRIGALLYMHVTLQEFPMAVLGSVKLAVALRERVMKFKVMDKRQGVLLVWLLFMGGLEVTGEERAWFVEQGAKVVKKLGIGTWQNTKEAFSDLWWIERLHDERGEKLWKEIEIHYMVDALLEPN